MNKNGSSKSKSQLRKQLAVEAARLMYEEGVKQYFDAKRMAAKRFFNNVKTIRYRPRDLPSNGEISDELMKFVALHEGEGHDNSLFSMRMTALDIMVELEPFKPRLIGSVSTGRIRKGSDIDLHVFTDSFEELENYIKSLGWEYEKDSVLIKNNNKFQEYNHIYLHKDFPVELSVYPTQDLRVRGRSSTDGKPIVRLKYEDLQNLIMCEHEQQWNNYLDEAEYGLVGKGE